ncbi:MAG TPA: PD-(D/E)XK nuclease family protein [Brevibacterium sp.]|nr:PD-(D/E)XK nuclease family protein [Brevibacterium sp.]
MTELRTNYSSIQTFRRCPQAWAYSYRFKLEEDETGRIPVERDFGSWWAALRAAFALERGRELDTLLPISGPIPAPGVEWDPEDVTVEAVLDAAADWFSRHLRQTVEEGEPTIAEMWEGKLGVTDLRVSLRNTLARWEKENADELRSQQPLGVEVPWERHLDRPQSEGLWNGAGVGGDDWPEDLPTTTGGVTLFGHVDLIYYDTRREIVVVADDKTRKELTASDTADDMMDSQLHLYAWGVSPLIKEHLGKVPRAVSYIKTRSVQPRPPHLTTAGKLASRGGEPSLASCDLDTYLEWARDGVEWLGPKKPKSEERKPGGIYHAEEKVIEKLKTEAERSRWFQTTLSPLSRPAVRAHLLASLDSADGIAAATRRVDVTGEAPRNITPFTCRWCDFAKLCRAQMVGGPEMPDDVQQFGLRPKARDIGR